MTTICSAAMDPTTTLVTFLLQTDPAVQSLHLIGSWDNFSTAYTMKRDVRRGAGQWRGCYSFKDIVCDDEAIPGSTRNGGLKMGATYYYYYELDGSTETHDPAEPWTTACPYLPGQTVNTLTVPIEYTLRKRSASLNSMHLESFRTMDPNAKFATPRPVPSTNASIRRLVSASSFLFTRPELAPTSLQSRHMARQLDDDDDDTREKHVCAASLPPPLLGPCASSDTLALAATNASSATLTPTRQKPDEPSPGSVPASLGSGTLAPQPSPQSVEDEPPSFCDSNDEDEVLSSNDDDILSHRPLPGLPAEQVFKCYSLPRQSYETKGMAHPRAAVANLHSPQLLARGDSGLPIGGANLLGATIDNGLDDLVSELGWIVDVISSRHL